MENFIGPQNIYQKMLYKIVKTPMGTEQVFTLEYCVANAVQNIGIAMIGNILPRKQCLVGIISLKDELKSN